MPRHVVQMLRAKDTCESAGSPAAPQRTAAIPTLFGKLKQDGLSLSVFW